MMLDDFETFLSQPITGYPLTLWRGEERAEVRWVTIHLN